MDKAKIIAQTSITAEKLRDPEFLIKYVRAGLPIEDYYAIRDLALLGLESARPEALRSEDAWPDHDQPPCESMAQCHSYAKGCVRQGRIEGLEEAASSIEARIDPSHPLPDFDPTLMNQLYRLLADNIRLLKTTPSPRGK